VPISFGNSGGHETKLFILNLFSLAQRQEKRKRTRGGYLFAKETFFICSCNLHKILNLLSNLTLFNLNAKSSYFYAGSILDNFKDIFLFERKTLNNEKIHPQFHIIDL
jgi:hypothetical protein